MDIGSTGSTVEEAGLERMITPETLIGRMAIVHIRNFKLPIMGFIKNLGKGVLSLGVGVASASAFRSSVNRLGGTKLVNNVKILKDPNFKKGASWAGGLIITALTGYYLYDIDRKNKEVDKAQPEKEEEATK